MPYLGLHADRLSEKGRRILTIIRPDTVTSFAVHAFIRAGLQLSGPCVSRQLLCVPDAHSLWLMNESARMRPLGRSGISVPALGVGTNRWGGTNRGADVSAPREGQDG